MLPGRHTFTRAASLAAPFMDAMSFLPAFGSRGGVCSIETGRRSRMSIHRTPFRGGPITRSLDLGQLPCLHMSIRIHGGLQFNQSLSGTPEASLPTLLELIVHSWSTERHLHHIGRPS
jgi:hypothetical protein